MVGEKTPPGSPQGKATTDANGEFEFSLMEASDTVYSLYVNMPGLPMSQSHQVMIGQNDLLHDQLDLCVDLSGTYISTCTALGIESPSVDSRAISVYPNPNNGGFQVSMGRFEGAMARMSISDVSGRAVQEHAFENAPPEFRFSGIPEGYYLLRISDGKRAESLSVCVIDR